MTFERLTQAIERDERAVLFTVIEGEPLGAHMLVLEDGERVGDELPQELAAQAGELIRNHTNRILELGDARVFAEIFAPLRACSSTARSTPPSRSPGWRGSSAGRRSSPTRARSSQRMSVSRVRPRSSSRWPEETIEQVAPDHATAVVVLTHDDKFDVPALKAALATEAFYVGALGSRRNQERRRERLLEAGVDEAELDASRALADSTSAPSRSQRRRSRSWPRSSPVRNGRRASPSSPSSASTWTSRNSSARVRGAGFGDYSVWKRSARPTRNGGRELDPDRYAILRQAATEAPWSGDLLAHPRGRHLSLRRVQRRALPLGGEVRVGLGLAELSSPPPKTRSRSK